MKEKLEDLIVGLIVGVVADAMLNNHDNNLDTTLGIIQNTLGTGLLGYGLGLISKENAKTRFQISTNYATGAIIGQAISKTVQYLAHVQ